MHRRVEGEADEYPGRAEHGDLLGGVLRALLRGGAGVLGLDRGDGAEFHLPVADGDPDIQERVQVEGLRGELLHHRPGRDRRVRSSAVPFRQARLSTLILYMIGLISLLAIAHGNFTLHQEASSDYFYVALNIGTTLNLHLNNLQNVTRLPCD